MEDSGRSTNRILVVDDERPLRVLVRLYLEKDGFIVDEAAEGREALDRIRGQGYRLVVLDLMMPGMDGWELCRAIRRFTDMPILILTARGEVDERVTGLEMGADDYLVKPFDPRELLARVHALLRRSGATRDERKIVRHSRLRIDPQARTVTLNEQILALSPKEFDLLHFLARHPGRVFSREQLFHQVWRDEFFGETRTVDSHIKNLRDKIEAAGGDRGWIATAWGIGYKFEAGVD